MGIAKPNKMYNICWPRWKMAMDFFLGGRHVLEPDWRASSGHYITEKSDTFPMDDSGSGRNESGYEWIPSSFNSYLWKHASERPEEYNERHARAYHTPIFGPVDDIFTSGIFKAGQVRDYSNPVLSNYFEDVDLHGSNIDTFMRMAFSVALACGRNHIVTDMPRLEGGLRSLAEQQRMGIRAFSKTVSPLDLIDWEIDKYNEFIWVVFKEKADSERIPGVEEESNPPENYRVLTRSGWQLYQAKDQSTDKLIGEGAYPAALQGTVPMTTIWTAKFKDMDCESPLGSIVDGDRHLFNKNSELDTLERLNGFAVLGIPNIEGVPLGFIELGPGRAITYPAAAGSPVWLSTDPDLIKGLADRNRERMDILRVAAGVTRGAAEGSKELRSAAALSEESENKRNQMSIWAANCEEAENNMIDHVSKYHGVSNPPKTKYKQNFSLQAISTQINNLLQLNATETVEDNVKLEIVKPIVSRMLQENGTDQREVEKMVQAMKVPEKEMAPEQRPNFFGVQDPEKNIEPKNEGAEKE